MLVDSLMITLMSYVGGVVQKACIISIISVSVSVSASLFPFKQEENILFHDATISYIVVAEPSIAVCHYMEEIGMFSDDDKVFLKLLHGQAIKKPGKYMSCANNEYSA